MFLFGKSPPAPFVSAVIVAAGSASRMGGVDKQQTVLHDIPVVVRSIIQFQDCADISEIVVVCREEHIADYYALVRDYGLDKVVSVVKGGAERQDSVFSGIAACSGEAEYYAIHDGARPLVTQEVIGDCLEAAVRHGAAAAAVPVKDTIKVCDESGRIVSTPARRELYSIQTPQIFAAGLYRGVMEQALREGKRYTDDCQLLERAGKEVYISPGSYENLKITTPEDLVLASAILGYRGEGIENWQTLE